MRATAPSPPAGGRLRRLALVVALLLATAAVYRPALDHGYVLYDDDAYVSDNARLQGGLTGEGARWALRAARGATWQPLVWLSYLADVSRCGMKPRCFHATNVLLHLANVALLFAVATLMGGGLLQSLLISSLFALHPIHVEAVAWISARKDVLSTFFFLLSLGAWGLYARRPGPGRYVASLVTFALGLMAKPMLVTLPLLLLLLDWWPLGRFRRGDAAGAPPAGPGPGTQRLLLEKIPFLVLGALSAAVTYVVQHGAAAVGEAAKFPPLFRVFHAAHSCLAYLRKLVCPSDLAAAYPMPLSISWAAGLSSLGALLLATGLALGARKRAPCLFTGWFWYAIALLPVIQLVPIGSHAMADRFAYIPFMGIYAMLACLAGRPRRPAWRAAAAAGAAAAVVLLAGLTRRQIAYWSDTRTLFERSLAVDPVNWLAHNNLGVHFARGGDAAAAAEHFAEALRIRPDYPEARENLERARRALQGRR